jgi:protoporphyrinogen oxidase
MEKVRVLVVGAGMSGLSAAAFAPHQDVCVLERDQSIGGYCKTVKQDGFVWDYSGHFFHFKHPDIEAWLRERMPGQDIRTIEKKSFVDVDSTRIDFPFQKNIHQLPKQLFIDCLVDLYFAQSSDVKRPAHAPQGNSAAASSAPPNFKEMLLDRFGKAICDTFLVPYNEKLYACDLASLDRNAMGRFFPHADLTDIIRNMKTPDNASYNASFTYPAGGAIEYVNAVASRLPAGMIHTDESVLHVDLPNHIVKTTKRTLRYETLVSSMPWNRLLQVAGVAHDETAYSWNKVLVFNLGFDTKGPDDVHWMYYPSKAISFYRIGFYDNIFGGSRMSLYVELGFARDAKIDVAAARAQVLADLRKVGIVADHKLISEHNVIMDPAYVHITDKSIAERARIGAELEAQGVFSIGRYGGWTYCSIEDNIVEARALMRRIA